jgi:hypothetical protein
MITIQTRVSVDEQGVATLRMPPEVAPGDHEVVLVIEESPSPRKSSIMEGFPRHDVAIALPEGFSFRRQELYDDSWN